MKQGHSWEVSGRWIAKNSPTDYETPKFHYCGHKKSPLVSILSLINPVHIIPPYFSKI
jgi:hypothetical protein